MKDFNINNIDDQFKNHFSNASTPVEQSETLWDAIQQKRQAPKRRFLLWVFALGLLCLGLGSYAYFSTPTTDTSIVLDASTEMQNQTTVDQTISEQTLSETTTTETKIPESTLSEKQNPTITLSAKQAYTPQQTNNSETSFTEKTKTVQYNSKATSSVVTIETTQNTPTAIAPTTKTIALSRKETGTEMPIGNMTNQKTFIQTTTGLIAIAPPSLLESPYITLDIPFQEKPTEELPKKKQTWDKCRVKESGNLFVNIYGQAALPFERISEKNNGTGEPITTYTDAWKGKFTPFMSYSGGFQVGYEFPWRGYASAGLTYQHFQTKFEENQTVVERITIYDDMAYFYIDQQTGETVWVADSITVTNIYDRTETHANNHQLWHIPIQLGYMLDKNNFRVGANVEALINISKSYKGHFLNQNQSISVIDTANDPDYMSTNIGLSISAGLHVGYMLNDHWEIYLNPRFRFNSKSFLDETQALSISRNFAGLRTGLFYHF